jgi:hypothetical protein
MPELPGIVAARSASLNTASLSIRQAASRPKPFTREWTVPYCHEVSAWVPAMSLLALDRGPVPG